MADRRRIVTFSTGGRPVLEVDLEVSGTFQAVQGTFAYQPGQSNQATSQQPSQYGGQQVVGERNDNGTVTWQALVYGNTADQAAANIETLLAAANSSDQGRLLEWRPDGSTYSSYFRVAGPGTWKPTYQWAQWQGAQSMLVDVTFPVRPLVLWDPMTIVDALDVDSRADYTFDASTSADINIDTTGRLIAPVVGAALTAERRARHTVRGYQLLEGQSTIRFAPGTTVTNFKAGVLLRASAANTYVEVYVDDNGTNSRLRVDVVIAGSRTNRSTTNLGSRISSVSSYFVRGRIEGNTVSAEFFTATPSPMSTPTTSASYTLISGEQTSLVAGYSGWSFVPQHAAAALAAPFAFQPFTYRNRTFPASLPLKDAIPGSAPALADVILTTSGGADNPAWPLVAWPGGSGFFNVYDFASMTLAGTPSPWASSAQAGARSGFDVRVTTSGAGTYTAAIDFPSVGLSGDADDFLTTVDVEVWARVLVSSGLVNPRMNVQIGAYSAGSGMVGVTSTLEYGTLGKSLVKPASGTVYRYVRLGTVTVDATVTATIRMLFTGTVDAGSTGVFGVDYMHLVTARRRLAGPTGVAASTVSEFVPSTAEWTKRIRSDLSATLEAPSFGVVQVIGAGGSLIEPPAGARVFHVKLSNLVPDDPTSDTTSEQATHNATLSLDVTPRSYMFRGG